MVLGAALLRAARIRIDGQFIVGLALCGQAQSSSPARNAHFPLRSHDSRPTFSLHISVLLAEVPAQQPDSVVSLDVVEGEEVVVTTQSSGSSVSIHSQPFCVHMCSTVDFKHLSLAL